MPTRVTSRAMTTRSSATVPPPSTAPPGRSAPDDGILPVRLAGGGGVGPARADQRLLRGGRILPRPHSPDPSGRTGGARQTQCQGGRAPAPASRPLDRDDAIGHHDGRPGARLGRRAGPLGAVPADRRALSGTPVRPTFSL